MFENPECTDCILHHTARNPCMESIGDQDCKLAIYLDAPAVIEDIRGRSFIGENAEFVKFSLQRMSVSLDDVYMDYIVKCYPKKLPGKKADRMACVAACAQYRFAGLEHLPHLKAIVVLGGLGCEVMTQHKTIGDRAGAEWEPFSPMMKKFIKHVWVGFSPGILREKPAEAPAIYRVIFKAAEEAGLNPKPNLKLTPYEFPDKKQR